MYFIQNSKLIYVFGAAYFSSMTAPEFPAALSQEDGTMFVEAATRVGIAYAASLVAFAVLLHVLA